MELKLGKKKIKVKKKWLIIGGIAIVMIVVGIAIVINKNKQSLAFTMNTMSATVETGSISTTIEGTGTLANDSAVDIEIPSGLEIEEVKVNSGDEVKAGDILATVDEQSLIAELASIEEQIQDKDSEINSTSSGTTTDTIKAKVSGRIKKVFVAVEDNVTDVMVENEALMLMSLDGKMAVDIETSQSLNVNDSVNVVLSDDTIITGTVSTKTQFGYTVTVTDNGTNYEEAVTVNDSDGNTIGTGNLYIHQELKIIGTKGTVSKVSILENAKVSSDTTLITLTGNFNSATYETLLKERSSLEKQCSVLLSILQNGGIVADMDGVITAINILEQSSSTSTSSSDAKTMGMSSFSENTAVLLASTAYSEESVSIDSNVKETKVGANNVAEIMSLEGFTVTAPVLGQVPQDEILDTDSYIGTITWNPSCTTFLADTTYTANIELTANEGYCFSENTEVKIDNAVVSGVNISEEGITLNFMLTFPKTGSGEQVNLDEQSAYPVQESISESALNAQQLTSSQASGTSGGSSNSSSPSSSSNSSSDDDNEDMIAAFSIASSENMLVTISVDELDILSVEVGQKATLTLEAIPNELFEGQITSVSREGTSNGGTTKYKVEITLPKNGDMIAGMNASASIIITESTDVLLVPAMAIQERGNRTFVYTEEGTDGVLSGEVEVETGNSDGTNIEITSVLSNGDTVYYQMPVISTSSDTQTMEGFQMQGNMMESFDGSGQGFSGEPPSGGPSGEGFPVGGN